MLIFWLFLTLATLGLLVTLPYCFAFLIQIFRAEPYRGEFISAKKFEKLMAPESEADARFLYQTSPRIFLRSQRIRLHCLLDMLRQISDGARSTVASVLASDFSHDELGRERALKLRRTAGRLRRHAFLGVVRIRLWMILWNHRWSPFHPLQPADCRWIFSARFQSAFNEFTEAFCEFNPKSPSSTA